MAIFRRQNASPSLFKCLVVPALLLCAIFHNPVTQWISVGALVVWLVAQIAGPLSEAVKRTKDRCAQVRQAKVNEAPAAKPSNDTAAEQKSSDAAKDPSESEVFTIRQVNYRILDALKESYPLVSWLWDRRPEMSELCKGGTWRIRVENADPFNFADVTISDSGAISIMMLQAVPLKEAQDQSAEDLTSDDLLDRVDVKSWYNTVGEKILTEMIDNLNAQGHKRILIKEDGEVCVTLSGKEKVVETIKDFPPRTAWQEFCHLLAEDEIKATVQAEGLAMAW